MNRTAVVFGVLASVLHLTGYILYNMQTREGKSVPNPASWGIWTFFAVLNASSYAKMSGNWYSALQFYTGSVACALTFLHALFAGKFSKVNEWDKTVFLFGVCVTVLWWLGRNATVANYLRLMVFFISFMATVRMVHDNPTLETPRSWIIWTVACGFTLASAVVQRHWVSVMTPLALVVAHALVAVLSRRSRQEAYLSLSS